MKKLSLLLTLTVAILLPTAWDYSKICQNSDQYYKGN